MTPYVHIRNWGFKQKLKASAYLGTRRVNKKVLCKEQKKLCWVRGTLYSSIRVFFSRSCHQNRQRLRRGGLNQQGAINEDATIGISNRSDYNNRVCLRLTVHYRSWWARGRYSLWSTQSLFEVCYSLIIYLSGAESHLTLLFLHSSSESNTDLGAWVFKVKLHVLLNENKGSYWFFMPM